MLKYSKHFPVGKRRFITTTAYCTTRALIKGLMLSLANSDNRANYLDLLSVTKVIVFFARSKKNVSGEVVQQNNTNNNNNNNNNDNNHNHNNVAVKLTMVTAIQLRLEIAN